jgi:hypothetical protein
MKFIDNYAITGKELSLLSGERCAGVREWLRDLYPRMPLVDSRRKGPTRFAHEQAKPETEKCTLPTMLKPSHTVTTITMKAAIVIRIAG